MRKLLMFVFLFPFCGISSSAYEPAKDGDGWVTIFDGKSLDGWKINESKDSWKLAEGMLTAKGPRSHVFYVGDEKPFVNFEFKAEVMTRPGSNGGIFFHTKYQADGWPSVGHESQVNITQGDPQKTGGIYNVAKVLEAPAKDNEWWTQHILVIGRHVIVKINDKVVVDYTEPDKVEGTRKVDKGTFALQAHDPNSTVHYRNIRVKRLP
ncbi:MAG: DUF1080 domain-containing protein [Planctomycetes bacterium]|nr:DUF1080 domain-containing protein [Planctomycetota bacterium]